MPLLRLALLLLGVALLAHGGEGLYYAVRNGRMVTLTCQQFSLAPPQARWLRVTGCDIDYMHPAFTQTRDRVTELFFAMRGRNQAPNTPAALFVATRNPQALDAAQPVLGEAEVDEETFTVAMLRVVDILRAAREIDGYARSGLLQRLRTRQALAGFNAPLRPDALVLDLHARPSVVIPGSELAAGLVLGVTALALGRKRKVAVVAERPAAEPAETPPETAEAPAPAAPLERRLPAAMLLNLEGSAALSEIEYAPPLGRPEEVIARISAALGPLADDGAGRYSTGAPGWRLTFDLGRDDEVWTAAVDVRGTEAALEALDRLAQETGWRVYVPRLGSFR